MSMINNKSIIWISGFCSGVMVASIHNDRLNRKRAKKIKEIKDEFDKNLVQVHNNIEYLKKEFWMKSEA